MLTALTRLDAINLILGALGLAPISSLEGDETADVAAAALWLDKTSLAVQSRGWCWNTETEVTIIPDAVNHFITVPENYVAVDFNIDHCYAEDPVLRGTRLYDRKNHTYVFNGPSYLCDVKVLLDWEELPQPARQYVMVVACRKAASGIGDSATVKFTERDELQAYADLQQHEAEQIDANFLTSSLR